MHSVGQGSSARSFETVAFLVAPYDQSRRILGTDTFIVDAVGASTRVFDALVPSVGAAAVDDRAFQVGWTPGSYRRPDADRPT